MQELRSELGAWIHRIRAKGLEMQVQHHGMEELEQHIRFEERILFQEIQKLATAEELELVEQKHSKEKFLDNTEDEFWI